MDVSFRVTGETPAALRAAADEVATGFADGANYSLTIGDVYGETGFDEAAGRPTKVHTFAAHVTAKVEDPK